MEELKKMMEDSQFTIEDIVTEVVRKISANKRADVTRAFRVLNVLYNFSRSTCSSLLDAAMKNKRILKVHGVGRFYYVTLDCDDFWAKRLSKDGVVSRFIENSDKAEFREFKRLLVDSKEFESEKAFLDAVIDDVVAEKMRLINDEIEVYSEDEDPSSGSDTENETKIEKTKKESEIDVDGDIDKVKAENAIQKTETSRPIKRPQKDAVASNPSKRRRTIKKPVEVVSPVTKSGRVSSKKWDEDYYFPNLHKRNRARRILPAAEKAKVIAKTEKPEIKSEVKNESAIKTEDSNSKKNEKAPSKSEKASKNETANPSKSDEQNAIAGECQICKINCRVRDSPVTCSKCEHFAHTYCVKVEQSALKQEHSPANWLCLKCRQVKIKRLSCAKCLDPTSRWLGPLFRCSNCGFHFHETCLGQRVKIGQTLALCLQCFQQESERVIKNKGNPVSNMLVIEGIKCHEPASKIRNELRRMGYNVVKVTNMISNKNKKPLDMFSINMKSVASHSRLFRLNKFLGYSVKVKTPFSLKTDESRQQMKPVKGEVIEIQDSDEFEKSEDEKYESEALTSSESDDEIPNWHVLMDPSHPTLAPSQPRDDREFSPTQGSLAPLESAQIPEVTITRIRDDIPSRLIRPNRLHPPLDRPFPDPDVPDCEPWTQEQVSKYFQHYISQEVAQKFAQKNIDGTALKSLNRSQVLTGLDVKLDVALKILFHVKRLQLRTNDRTLIYADET